MSLGISFLIGVVLIIHFVFQYLIIALSSCLSCSCGTFRSAIMVQTIRSFVAILFQFWTCNVINLSLTSKLLIVKHLISLVVLTLAFYLHAIFLLLLLCLISVQKWLDLLLSFFLLLYEFVLIRWSFFTVLDVIF